MFMVTQLARRPRIGTLAAFLDGMTLDCSCPYCCIDKKPSHKVIKEFQFSGNFYCNQEIAMMARNQGSIVYLTGSLQESCCCDACRLCQALTLASGTPQACTCEWDDFVFTCSFALCPSSIDLLCPKVLQAPIMLALLRLKAGLVVALQSHDRRRPIAAFEAEINPAPSPSSRGYETEEDSKYARRPVSVRQSLTRWLPRLFPPGLPVTSR